MLDTNEEKIRLIQAVRKYPCLWRPQYAEYILPETKAETWTKVAEEMSSQTYACRKRWRTIKEGVMRTLRRDSEGNCKSTYYLFKHLDFLEPYLSILNEKTRNKNFPIFNMNNEQCEVMEDTQCNISTSSSTINSLSVQLAKEPINEEPSPPKILESAKEDANLLNIPVSSKAFEYAKEDANHINRPESKKKTMNNNDASNTVHIEWVKKKKDADGNQSFLNSLRPYLRDMTAKQNRRFQRKVIALIDEILEDADIPQVIFCSLPIETITESSEYQ